MYCKLEFLATRILIHRPQQGQSAHHTMVGWFCWMADTLLVSHSQEIIFTRV